jgi:flotillin
VAERLPEIVRAAAEPLGKIQNLTVLEGASGVTEVIGEVLGQVATILPAARGMFAQPTIKADGAEPVTAGTTEDGRVRG